MSIVQVRDALLWCVIINAGFLAVWLILVLMWPEWLNHLVRKLFRVPTEQVDAINYAGIVLYKMGIILFFLTPYVALRIVG